MDAIAGLAFGIVIIDPCALKARQWRHAGAFDRSDRVIAGVCSRYLPRPGYMAQTVPNGQSYESGAALLADSVNLTMGTQVKPSFADCYPRMLDHRGRPNFVTSVFSTPWFQS